LEMGLMLKIPELNLKDIEYYHYLASTIKGKDKQKILFARIYGRVEFTYDEFRPLLEPEYFSTEQAYPCLDFHICFGDDVKTEVTAQVHSYMFDEITDQDTQNCLFAEMQHPRNKEVYVNPGTDAGIYFRSLHDKHLQQLKAANDKKMALQATDSDGNSSTSVHVLQAFKFLLNHHFEEVMYLDTE